MSAVRFVEMEARIVRALKSVEYKDEQEGLKSESRTLNTI
jgi:hypothetical protein